MAFTLILPAVTFVYANICFSLPLFSIETFADRGPVIFGSLMTTNALVVVFLQLVIECGYLAAPPLLGKFMEDNPVRSVWPFAFFLACAACLALLILYAVERRYRRNLH